MSAMAAPVQRRQEPAIGVITVAGPLVRLTEERMRRFGDAVVAAAGELAMASATSPLFARRRR
jgi:IclR family transcriptional regulator, acetate operon repressor